jgi:hypothetical protein
MRSSHLTGIFALLLLLPLRVSGQEEAPRPAPTWQVTIAPRFGVFLPNRDMGAADGISVTMTTSPTAGLDVEVRTPVRWLSMRAIAETSVGSRLAERGGAPPNGDGCTGDCVRDPDALTNVGESSVLTFVADAVVRPRIGRARILPMAFAGAGVKRYDLTNAHRYVAGGQESAFTFHYGGGIDIPLGPIALSLEAADYVSVLGSAVRPVSTSVFIETPPPPPGPGMVKHDFFLTLGVRLFPR